nr:pseudaminic acid biosynthesis-associated methylase [Chitinophagaceae bacterium]
MSGTYQTDQEAFWSGEFGNEYINRNNSEQLLASNLNYFSKILEGCSSIGSILELGANIGMNLRALKALLPSAKISAVEINEAAYKELITLGNVKGYHQSIFDFSPSEQYDFVFVKGVLIHLNPDMLHQAYEKLYASSRNYVCIGEYYNPVPVTLSYRGHSDRLFKRDFAGEFMESYPDMELIKYGFAYRKDPLYP